MRPAVVGRDLLNELPELLPDASRIAVVTSAGPEAVRSIADRVVTTLTRAGRHVGVIEVPQGEQAKSYDVLARGWDALAAHGITRADAIVGVGGGAVTDAAGFLAATWLRGITVAHVPTTVLGVVDAAIGGKTAINIAAGKNLVGAVHPPAAVLCDLDVLTGLPPAEVASGLAEVVKCGFAGDPAILDVIEADPHAVTDTRTDAFAAVAERAIRYKERVVATDPTELAPDGVGRLALNYGHTLAHAIEHAEAYTIRHGAAVAVGLVYAAELARRAGRLGADVAGRHRTVLAAVGLPTAYSDAAWPDLRAAMQMDKKRRGAELRFVVLDGLARPGLLTGPDEELLRASYVAMCAGGADSRTDRP